MSKLLLVAAALACATAGMAWLALAMDVHWQQVRPSGPGRCAAVPALRTAGALALVASLLLCLRADHASMAALVWVMVLAASALAVAFTLAWWPRLLAPLVAWIR